MDYVLTLAILQGIVLFFVLRVKQFSDKRTVNLISVLLGLTVLIMFGRASYQPEFLHKYWAFVSLPDVMLFLFGPLTYMLTLSLLKRPAINNRGLILHGAPAILHASVFNVFLGLIIIGKLPGYDYSHLGLFYSLIEGAGIVSGISYLFFSWNAYNRYLDVYQKQYSSSRSSQFLKYFLQLEMILFLIWTISFIAKLSGFYIVMDYTVYHVFWIAVSFSIYLFTYQFLINPELFELPELMEPIETPQIRFELDGKELLENYMETERPYLNPELNLEQLALQTQLKRNELSALINAAWSMNFFDFINAYRVREFIQKFQERKAIDSSTTFLEIAFEAGFNSKSAFNRAFKKHVGVTPTEYFKINKQKEFLVG